jgi:hypothetical protein
VVTQIFGGGSYICSFEFQEREIRVHDIVATSTGLRGTESCSQPLESLLRVASKGEGGIHFLESIFVEGAFPG